MSCIVLSYNFESMKSINCGSGYVTSLQEYFYTFLKGQVTLYKNKLPILKEQFTHIVQTIEILRCSSRQVRLLLGKHLFGIHH